MELASRTSYRLGILVSHPIQYYAPWFRQLAARLDLEVFYAHQQDGKGQASAGFGVEFAWDIPLLEGYPFRWLKNVARNPGLSRFGGCDTPELYDLISPDRFDAFLVIGWNRKSSWQAIRACWKTGVPILMRGDSQLPMVTSRLKSLIKALPYRWFLPRIDGHLYVGQRNREYLQHYGVPNDRLFSCPHFVDNEFFAARAREAVADGRVAAIRRDLGIPEDAFLALFVGKLIQKKNPQHFIQAIKAAAKEASGSSRPIHGLVVGSGPLEAECRALAAKRSDRIHFAGFKNQTELPAYYAAVDALVLPSDGTETWGLVVNEAMACGAPCIVSSACGCSEDLIDEGQTGYTFPTGCVSTLSRRLQELSNDIVSRAHEVRHAVDERICRHSIESAANGLLEAISRIRATRGSKNCVAAKRNSLREVE